MRGPIVWNLLRKELMDSLRDRRTLAMLLLLPALLYPAVLVGTGWLMTRGQQKLATEPLTVAFVGDEAEVFFRARPPPPHTTYTRGLARGLAEQALREKDIAAFVEVGSGAQQALTAGEQAQVTVVYTQRHDRSREALARMRRLLENASTQVVERRLSELRLPPQFARPLQVVEQDVDFEQGLGLLIASRLLPTLLITMLFLGALYPALDATAGEKERGTLETLLVSPVSAREVMAAKYVTVTALTLLATGTNLLAMSLTLSAGLSVGPMATASFRLGLGQVALVAAGLLPAALLASALSLAVASLARNFKEGQSLVTPLAVLGTVPGMLALAPGVELTTATACVPLLNVALLIKAAVLGNAQWFHAVLTVASVAVCAALATAVAANAFESEQLRLGGGRWSELFQWRR